MRLNPFKPIYAECNWGNSRQKLDNLPIFPRCLDIELTNLCNFKCLMCPTGTGAHQRKKGLMSDAIFYKIIDEIKKYKTPLRFIRWGEPTLHPNLINFLRVAKENDSLIHINTNGKLIDKKMMVQLIDIPLDSIKFSFQGVDKKSYCEMRGIDFFDELLEKIKMLYELRENNSYPFIHISTTITYESKDQVKAFKDRVAKFTDLVTVGRTQLDFIDPSTTNLSESRIKTLILLKKQESIIKKHIECPEVFDKLSIDWDGCVTACCGDYDNKMVVGNIVKKSLVELWTSDKMNFYRQMLAEMRHDELDLCRTCYDTRSLRIS